MQFFSPVNLISNRFTYTVQSDPSKEKSGKEICVPGFNVSAKKHPFFHIFYNDVHEEKVCVCVFFITFYNIKILVYKIFIRWISKCHRATLEDFLKVNLDI